MNTLEEKMKLQSLLGSRGYGKTMKVTRTILMMQWWVERLQNYELRKKAKEGTKINSTIQNVTRHGFDYTMNTNTFWSSMKNELT